MNTTKRQSREFPLDKTAFMLDMADSYKLVINIGIELELIFQLTLGLKSPS